MKTFAHWGWTIILLPASFAVIIISMGVNLWMFQTSMEIDLLYALRYFLLPGVMGMAIAGVVALFSLLVAKNLFKNPHDAFFLPLNCILLADIIMRIVYPVIDMLLRSGISPIIDVFFWAVEKLGGTPLY